MRNELLSAEDLESWEVGAFDVGPDGSKSSLVKSLSWIQESLLMSRDLNFKDEGLHEISTLEVKGLMKSADLFF